jgi:hypothetical protein
MTTALQDKDTKGMVLKTLGRKKASYCKRPFPSKLYDILERAETDAKLNSVISWLPDGNAFQIHEPDEFMKTVLENHFRTQTRFKSFTRQVSIERGRCSSPCLWN